MNQTKKLVGMLPFALALMLGLSANAQPTATGTATLFNDSVVGVTITSGSSGYGWVPLVTITGGGGSGAGAYATISNGVVTAISVTNAGFGYTNPPQLVIAAPSTTLFSSSLVLDLPLDGSAVDAGPYNFTVITNGGGIFVTNRFFQADSALSLNGVNQNISIPYDARLYPTEMTLSAWVNFQQFNSLGTIWESVNSTSDGWRGFALLFDASGSNLQFLDYTGSGYNTSLSAPTTDLTAGTWAQIVITRATNSCAMFVNGVKVAFETGLTPYAKPGVSPMSLGANNNADSSGFAYYCPVTFDSVHIYDRALADSEVQTLYTNEGAPVVGVVVKTVRVNMMQLMPGKTYQLETSTNLSSWTDTSTSFAATNSTAFQDFDIIGTGMGYFRVVELP
jgi:hypothetical protein